MKQSLNERDDNCSKIIMGYLYDGNIDVNSLLCIQSVNFIWNIKILLIGFLDFFVLYQFLLLTTVLKKYKIMAKTANYLFLDVSIP